jgi:hypothetical protein
MNGKGRTKASVGRDRESGGQFQAIALEPHGLSQGGSIDCASFFQNFRRFSVEGPSFTEAAGQKRGIA